MAQQQPLLNLIDDLTGDIRDPSLLWQLAAIIGSVILGFALARLLKKRFGRRDETQTGMLRFGVESFGRVLVDAPCSGLGTLRRNPDVKWRQKPDAIGELQVKQAAILAGAARLLKGGGRLVYATCSFLDDENDFIAKQFLDTHPDFDLVPMSKVLAEQKIELEMGDYLKLLPHKHQTDGFFAAVFERKPMAKKVVVKEEDEAVEE